MSRTKWHPTLPPPPRPPPSPKILHFPLSRRNRRKPPKSTAAVQFHCRNPSLLHFSPGENQENPYDLENEPHVIFFTSNQGTLAVERRERVEGESEECGGGSINEFEKEKWMFQAEILRAECNSLRMEREFAFKKLERNKAKMEKTLRSAVHTLVSRKKKIFEGKNVKAVLEKGIEDLSEKLKELHNNSSIKDYELSNCCNFDTKACLLQYRLEKLGELSDESCLNELQEESSSLSTAKSHHIDKQSCVSSISKIENTSTQVDEYCSMFSSTPNISTSKEIDESPIFSSFSNRKTYQEPILHEDNRCLVRCKSIIRRIVDQVRAETEQWSQMQEMLGQVRSEMEQLQASRDFWENRAHSSDYEIQSLKHAVEEWREKALGYKIKANELQLELSALQEELRKFKAALNLGQNSTKIKFIQGPLRNQLEKKKYAFSYHKIENQHSYEKVCEFENAKGEPNIEEKKARTPTKDSIMPISLAKQLANEKRMIFCRLKEKRHASEKSCMQEEELSNDGREKLHSKRSPLGDIGNLQCLVTEN